jgi:hypothetical protein
MIPGLPSTVGSSPGMDAALGEADALGLAETF